MSTMLCQHRDVGRPPESQSFGTCTGQTHHSKLPLPTTSTGSFLFVVAVRMIVSKMQQEYSRKDHGRIRSSRTTAVVMARKFRRWFILIVVATMVWVSIPPVHGFANHRKKNNSSNSGGGSHKKPVQGGGGGGGAPKGFGVQPPSLETILSTFPSRRPTTTTTTTTGVDCPCGSGQTYDMCCGPLHNQSRKCHSMVDVLRSRYSAFCWRDIGHILATTHPTNRDYREDKVAWAKELHKEGMFDSFEFVRLDIGTEEMGIDENEGFVEFQVTLRGRGGGDENERGQGRGGGGSGRRGRQIAAAVSGLETVVKERSRFLRDADSGIWSYAGGDVTSEVAGLQDTKLNV